MRSCITPDHRLSRNFYKGVKGDAINVLLAAAAYNFKRAMRVLLDLIKRISIELVSTGFMLKYSFLLVSDKTFGSYLC